MHLLAEDFDTDIDHDLDEMRFHRSRVNYITKAEPIGVTDTLQCKASTLPQVYLPFSGKRLTPTMQGDTVEIKLPEGTPYVLLYFPK